LTLVDKPEFAFAPLAFEHPHLVAVDDRYHAKQVSFLFACNAYGHGVHD
jgi:hypothetical protein